MAEILDGSSDHQGHAPLSQAQTIAVCKHLQSEIQNIGSILSETQRELQHTSETVRQLKSKPENGDVHELQVGFAEANITISKLQSELERNVQNTQNLTGSDQSNKGKIVQLEEARKMIDTRLDAISGDLAQQREVSKRIQDDIGNRLNEDIRVLHKIGENANLSLEQFTKEQKQIAQMQKDDRECLRDVELRIQSMMNEVKKTNTVTNILENRLASTAKGVQQNWAKLADLSDGHVKLTECYEKTRCRVSECEAQIKNLSDTNKQTNNELEDAFHQIERNTDKLSQALKLLDEEGSSTEEMRHQLNSLRQSGENATRRITQIAKDLLDVTTSTQQLRAGMKEQSSLLLPNIHMDSPEAKSAGDRHGSLLFGSTSRNRSSNSIATPRSTKWT